MTEDKTLTNSIHSLFKLDQSEKIYDDFGCAYSDSILYHGRIFITQNYLCFNSNLLGFSKKFKLKLKDIDKISKTKLVIIDNSIEISLVSSSQFKDNKILFTSFSNRDTVYNRIKDILKSRRMKKQALQGLSSSDEEEESQSQSQSQIERRSLNEKLALNERQDKTTNKNNDSLKNSNTDLPSVEDIEDSLIKLENDYIELPKFIIPLSLPCFFEEFFQNSAEHGKKSYVSSLPRASQVECENWSSLEKDIPFGEELRRQIIEKNKENKENPNENIEKIDFPSTSSSFSVFTRLFKFKSKLVGVPFVDSSRIIRCEKLVIKKNMFIVTSSSRSIDTPYSDYFTIDENIECVRYVEDPINQINNEKTQEFTLVRFSFRLVFTKNTFFRPTIEERVKEENKKELFEYKNYVSQFYSVRNYVSKQKTRLSHGLMKESNEDKLMLNESCWFNNKYLNICYFFIKESNAYLKAAVKGISGVDLGLVYKVVVLFILLVVFVGLVFVYRKLNSLEIEISDFKRMVLDSKEAR